MTEIDEEAIERAVRRVQDWVVPRLAHPSAAEAMRLRGVVENAVREAASMQEVPDPEFVQMTKGYRAKIIDDWGGRGTYD